MPRGNQFRHQQYHGEAGNASFEFLTPTPPPVPGSDEFERRMARVGDIFRRANVRAIYLLHGTFVGSDAWGLIRDLARVLPKAATPLFHWHKQLWDSWAGEAGNFTREYAAEFERTINSDGNDSRRISVRPFHWSSENHHIGRADGAVRLLDELLAHEEYGGGRVLLWGHSHGGNVLALASNLLANDRASNRRFFRAARSYYRWTGSGATDLPVWERVRSALRATDHVFSRMSLDLVTLGTPVRYGWDTAGCGRLLHFINHRPVLGQPAHRAPFPPAMDDVLTAADGDYVQQLGIAGTDAVLPFWSFRARLAERRLKRLLQPGLLVRDTLARLRLGVRLHADGINLLVNYGPPAGHVGQHCAGHAVYTRLSWLLFHAEEVARQCYQPF